MDISQRLFYVPTCTLGCSHLTAARHPAAWSALVIRREHGRRGVVTFVSIGTRISFHACERAVFVTLQHLTFRGSIKQIGGRGRSGNYCKFLQLLGAAPSLTRIGELIIVLAEPKILTNDHICENWNEWQWQQKSKMPVPRKCDWTCVPTTAESGSVIRSLLVRMFLPPFLNLFFSCEEMVWLIEILKGLLK